MDLDQTHKAFKHEVAVKEKQFVNVIADQDSWMSILDSVPVQKRTSRPGMYVEDLLRNCGRPMYFDLGWIEIHLYPPDKRLDK